MSAGWPGAGRGWRQPGMSHWPAGKGLAPGLREPKRRRVRQHCRPPPRSRGPTFEEKMGWGRLRQGPLPFQRGHFADGATEASSEGRRPCAAHRTRALCAPAPLPAPLSAKESPWHGPLRDRPQLPMCWPAWDLLGPSQSRVWAWGSSLGVGFGGVSGLPAGPLHLTSRATGNQ